MKCTWCKLEENQKGCEHREIFVCECCDDVICRECSKKWVEELEWG